TSLVAFRGTNGENPLASLLMGKDGNLYGTTFQGGSGGGGTIFRVVLTPSFTSIAKLPNGNIQLNGNGPASSPFRLWAASNLLSPSPFWTLLTSNIVDASGAFSFTDQTAADSPRRFYRISVP